jgi:hypothetical protein
VKTTKPPVVAWWGIAPVIFYGLLVLVFGWPRKGDHPNNAGYTMGYMLGGFFTGVVIPLVPAWIAYRLFRRSSLAGTLVFSLGVAFFALVLLGRFALERLPRPGSPPSIVPATTSFGDFRLDVPAGWVTQQLEREKTKASIVRTRRDSQVIEAILKVAVGKPTKPDALQTAQTLAGSDGRVVPERISLDGVQAIRVETPSGDISRPCVAAVALRKGELYLILAAGQDRSEVIDAFDEVIDSWHWNEAPRSGHK